MDQWKRWNDALTGAKLDMGERGNPPSGYFRKNAGTKGWEAIAVFRDDNGTLGCVRNIFGDGSNLNAEQIEELFASEIYAVPYDIYVAVAEDGQSWPAEYTTRLSLKEIAAGVGMTAELGRKKLGLDLAASKPVSQLDASDDATKRDTPPTEPSAPDWGKHVDAFRAALLQTTTHDDTLTCFERHDVDGLPRSDRARMETMLDTHRWTLTERLEAAKSAEPENPRAVIGGNNPPEETPYKDAASASDPAEELTPDRKLASEASQLAVAVKTWLKEIGGKPRNKAEADKIADYGTTLKRMAKSAEDQRKAEKKPVLEQARLIDTKWDAAKSVAEPAGKYCHDTAEKWRLAENERLAEEARVAAEAAEKDASLPPAEAPRQITGTGNMRTVSGRSRPIFHVEDPRAYGAYLLAMKTIPADLLDVMNKIAQRQGAAGVEMPGVTKEQIRSAA